MLTRDPAEVIETRSCTDCGEIFNFTEGERAFFKDRGLAFRPNRCRLCREIKKLRDRGAEVHIASCVQCGDRCALPFSPRPDKGVLCRGCYRADAPASQNVPENGSQ